MNDSKPKPPQLDAPGAGLPVIELFLARIGFRALRTVRSRAYWDDLFAVERARIEQLVQATEEDAASSQLLVKRLRGLEDSSRFWSIYMVLDHLNIVNRSVVGAVVAMSRGVVPESAASTASVKPNPGSGAETIGQFEKQCDQFQKLVGGITVLKTKVRYAHPWFGPLDAAGWNAMAAFHMRLHRKQIQAIQAGLVR